jgi:hypothetical protein
MLHRRAMEDMEFRSGLVDYNLLFNSEESDKWDKLSSYITREVVTSIQPASMRHIHSTRQPSSSSESTPSVFWSPIGPVRVPRDVSPASLSRMHMDTSTHLLQFIESTKYTSQSDCVLGELQAAYILFQLGQNYEAFLQYRRLIELFMGCSEDGVRDHVELFSKLIPVLSAQIEEFPEDFLVEDSDNPVFIIALLARFAEVCDGLDIGVQQLIGNSRLERVLARKFGKEWKLLARPTDDDPIVVDDSV